MAAKKKKLITDPNRPDVSHFLTPIDFLIQKMKMLGLSNEGDSLES